MTHLTVRRVGATRTNTNGALAPLKGPGSTRPSQNHRELIDCVSHVARGSADRASSDG